MNKPPDEAVTQRKSKSLQNVSMDVVAVVLATVVSLTLHGFEFGVSNNTFHIPYVLRWDELEKYSDDAFYQTLPRFYSAFWWVVRVFASEQDLPQLFLGLHVAGRVAAFAALAWMLRQLPLLPSARFAVLCFLAVTPLMQGPSMVGSHDLFVDYLSHTPLTWPFIVGALCLAPMGRWRVAALAAGITFLINAFVGVWLAVVLAAQAWSHRRQIGRRQAIDACVLFVLCCLPIVLWSMTARGVTPAQAAFDYREYIRSYFAYHFLIDSVPLLDVLNVLGLWVCVWLTFTRLRWHDWRRVHVTLMALIVALGALVYVVDSRMIFNLHGLRAEGVIEFLAMPLLAAAAMVMFRRRAGDDAAWASLLLLALLTGRFLPAALGVSIVALSDRPRSRSGLWAWALLAAAAAIGLIVEAAMTPTGEGAQGSLLVCVALVMTVLIARGLSRRRRLGGGGVTIGQWVAIGVVLLLVWRLVGLRLFVIPTAALVLLASNPTLNLRLAPRFDATGTLASRLVAIWPMLVLVMLQTVLSLKEMHASLMAKAHPSALTRDWVDLTEWVRRHPVTGVVLVPVEVPKGVEVLSSFQLDARTSVWVDWKQGAAVMWAPSFYATWGSRYAEVSKLKSPEDFRDYARSRNVPLFVAQRSTGGLPCPVDSVAIYQNSSFALCQVS